MAQKQARYGTRSSAARHEGFLRHARFRWLKIALALSVAAYLISGRPEALPTFGVQHTGGTWYGYTLGTIAALLILWLTLLGLRKRAMTQGSWSLKAWVSAHVYLGLSLIVIATLHSGFQFAWNVHTLAYVLMMLVIASGIFGIAAYSLLPRLLSENRAETTQKQMLELIRSFDSRLFLAAQPLDEKQAVLVRNSIERTRLAGSFWQRLTGIHLNCATRRARRKLARMRRRMGEAPQGAALDSIIGLLQQKSVTLTKIRRHLRLRALLEVWLYIHVPMTFALLAALAAHIVSVFFYW